jgi:hypothetical protein
MDATTGALLVAAPRFTLGLIGLSLPEGGDVLMQFIGTIVGGIGMSYLWGLMAKGAPAKLRRLYGTWGATAVARAAVAVFSISAVTVGSLEPQWLVVGFTDGILAITQTVLLRKGWLNGESAT